MLFSCGPPHSFVVCATKKTVRTPPVFLSSIRYRGGGPANGFFDLLSFVLYVIQNENSEVGNQFFCGRSCG